MNSTLRDLYLAHHGKVADKWSIYLDEYHRVFQTKRDDPLSLLEIGIQNGGSIEIWGQYFQHAEQIIGNDIDPRCGRLLFDDKRIHIVVGNAGDNQTKEEISKLSEKFDIIIDDGSHLSGDIIKCFAKYFPMLRNEGVFVIEDLHCSYWREFQGGLGVKCSSIEFLKALSDVINFEHWGLEKDAQEHLSAFGQIYGVTFDLNALSQIHSIEFVNSMCFIKKRQPIRNILGERISTGRDRIIYPPQPAGSKSVAIQQPAPTEQTSENLGSESKEIESLKMSIKVAETALVAMEAGYLKAVRELDSFHNFFSHNIGQIQSLLGIENKGANSSVVPDIAGLVDDFAILRKRYNELEGQTKSLKDECMARVGKFYAQLEVISQRLGVVAPGPELSQLNARLVQLSAMKFNDPKAFDASGHLGFIEHSMFIIIKVVEQLQRGVDNFQDRITERDRIIAELQGGLSSLSVRIARKGSRIAKELSRSVPGARGGMRWLATIIDGKHRLPPNQSPIVAVDAKEPPVVPISPEAWVSSNLIADTSYRVWLDSVKVPAPSVQSVLISVIIPVYKIPARVLARTIGSLIAQTYIRWEACIAFADAEGDENLKLLQDWCQLEPRLRLIVLGKNLGISGNSNAALAIAQGEWIALLDHDDELPTDALARMMTEVLGQSEIDLWYTDKDCLDDASGQRVHPLVKPAWSPEMLYSVNYLTHLNLMRTAVVKNIGGWRAETDGAQDWDIFLRVARAGRGVGRIIGVAYHWRIISGSTSTGVGAKPYVVSAQLRTIEDYVQGTGKRAKVHLDSECGFRVQWEIPAAAEVLVVIMPRAGRSFVVSSCLGPVLRKGFLRTRARYVACGPSQSTVPGWMVAADDRNSPIANLRNSLEGSSAEWVVLTTQLLTEATEGWIEDLVGWLVSSDSIRFAAPLVISSTSHVVEAGRIVAENGQGHPLFAGAAQRTWGVFGGPLWQRNVRAAGGYGLVCRRVDLMRYLSTITVLTGEESFFTDLCLFLVGEGGRGVVVPTVKVTIEDKDLPPPVPFDPSVGKDPFFHPALTSVARPSL